MTKQTNQFEEHSHWHELAIADQAEAEQYATTFSTASAPRIWWSKRRDRFEVIAFTHDLVRVFAYGPTEEEAYAAWKLELAEREAFEALPWWHWKRWLA